MTGSWLMALLIFGTPAMAKKPFTELKPKKQAAMLREAGFQAEKKVPKRWLAAQYVLAFEQRSGGKERGKNRAVTMELSEREYQALCDASFVQLQEQLKRRDIELLPSDSFKDNSAYNEKKVKIKYRPTERPVAWTYATGTREVAATLPKLAVNITRLKLRDTEAEKKAKLVFINQAVKMCKVDDKEDVEVSGLPMGSWSACSVSYEIWGTGLGMKTRIFPGSAAAWGLELPEPDVSFIDGDEEQKAYARGALQVLWLQVELSLALMDRS